LRREHHRQPRGAAALAAHIIPNEKRKERVE
jgi:hypothetical protein